MNRDRLSEAVSALNELVFRLRGPGGCPWDAVQTDDTVKMYLIEEAYEVLDAIDNKSSEDVREELGDLIFQIFFLSALALEREEFDLAGVIEGITEKMIRRHPHVFGGKTVTGTSEVSDNWERIKREEKKGDNSPLSRLRSVPVNLPSLLRAHRLSERAAKVGFDWSGKEEIWEKVKEEFLELTTAIDENDDNKVREETGDLMFSLVNLARHWGHNSEQLMMDANRKFIKRFERMEAELLASGSGIEEADMDEMDRVWESIKRSER
ncbi:MAG: nucleoside triphosphate pyrophosphohydrolase [Deltaproteobacteria bacterium]|nr:nucleoside triphosphate pyrophosphohydrolase [Deltaproteobacteria bacterium]